MRKLQITAIGAPADVMQLVEFQAPAPGPGQVLVEVEAATMNASDFLYITGQYFITPSLPPTSAAKVSAGSWLSAPARTSHWSVRGCCCYRRTATAPGPPI
jgi:hypothetical protein